MFITFEGGEGSGKTSQAKLLAVWLNNKNITTILTKEPGTPLVESCKKIRELLLSPESNISNRAEFFLYLADRAEHIDKCIGPALQSGQWVVSDRYIDSTLVYQGIGRGLGIENIERMIDYATHGIIPNITFIMNVSAEFGLLRAKKSNKEFVGGDRIERESLEFHEKLYEGFLQIAQTHERYIVLDATKSIDEIHDEVIKHVSKYTK